MARSLRLEELFEGRHFDREIIVLCVRWYLRSDLSTPQTGQQARSRLYTVTSQRDSSRSTALMFRYG